MTLQGKVAVIFGGSDGIDIVVNATGFMHDQGKGILELSLPEFRQGFDPFLSAMLNISKVVTPHMGGDRAGVILIVVAPAGATTS